jgi:hypothetical protein
MTRRFHNNASFGAGPRRPLTREDRARLRFLGRQYRLNRKLTPAWWDVLEALVSFTGPDGRCDPSVESVGLRAGGIVPSTVHAALNALESLGLLRRFPRLIRIGRRTQQTSSAYVLLPNGTPAALPAPLVPKHILSERGSSPGIGACIGAMDREAYENRDRMLQALGYGHLIGQPARVGA